MGFNLLHGRGTAVGAVEAVRYLRQAVAQGSKRAMCNLAYCYCAGLGVEKSLERASKLLQDASSPGYVASSTGMGRSEGPEPAQLDYARAIKKINFTIVLCCDFAAPFFALAVYPL